MALGKNTYTSMNLRICMGFYREQEGIDLVADIVITEERSVSSSFD